MPRRAPRRDRTPTSLVELLRLFIVVFGAGAGFQIAKAVGDSERIVLGPFDGAAIGVILGSFIGYVIGGVVGRTTLTSVDEVEARLREVDAEALIASGVGGVVGVLIAAGVAWPFLLIDESYVRFSLFAFVVVTIGYVGLRIGRSKRSGIMALLAGRRSPSVSRVGASLLPRVVDTSVAVDGRVVEVVRAGFLHGTMLLARPVLTELQGLADAADDVKRARGRRGLECLETLKREPGITFEVIDDDPTEIPDVDAKLVRICLDRHAALLTLDSNLAKAASLGGVRVLNLHGLALALRPPVQVGEDVAVSVTKPGKEAGQGIGYLDDGTMVVVERGRDLIGSEISVRVTSVIMTANGRMVFGQRSTSQ